MLLAVATPMHMIAPISAGTLSVVCRSGRASTTMPASAAGSAVMMMNGSSQRLEVHDDQQVDEHDREREAAERGRCTTTRMVSTWPRTMMKRARAAAPADRPRRCARCRGRRAPRSRSCTDAVDVDHRLDVVVRDHRHAAGARVIEATSPRIWGRLLAAPLIGMFWRSWSDWIEYCGVWVDQVVADAVLPVEPERSARSGRCRSATPARCWRRRAGVRPAPAALVRSTVTWQLRVVEVLLDAQVDEPGHLPQLGQQSVARPARLPSRSLPVDLHVDRRRQAEVQDLADDVGGQEENVDARETPAAAARAARARDPAVGRCPCLSVTRMSASAGADDAELLYEQVDAVSTAGRCCR